MRLNDQFAVRQLEALQAYRVHDKSFNIYARYQGNERAVGPGCGRGMTPPGSGGLGGGMGSHGASRFELRLDDQGHHTLTGYVHQKADEVYHANQRFEHDVRGR
ncbi:MAG: hypothetical protein QM747_15130 [Nocardioides sp.]